MSLLSKLVKAAVLASITLSASAFTWKNCGASTDAGSATDVQLNPVQPVRGEDEIITLFGKVSVPVNGGVVKLVVSYLGLPLYTNNLAVCQVLTCPLAVGNFSASITIPGSSFPSFAPAGTYIGHGTVADANGNELGCVDATFALP